MNTEDRLLQWIDKQHIPASEIMMAMATVLGKLLGQTPGGEDNMRKGVDYFAEIIRTEAVLTHRNLRR